MARKPLPDLPGVYYSTINALWEGLPSNNVFSFQVTPAPATGTADVLAANAVAAAIGLNWPAFALIAFHISYLAEKVVTYPLHTPIHPSVEYAFAAPGGKDETIAPGMVAAVISHHVIRRGKGSQTRTYLSPLGNGIIDSTGKEIIEAYRSDLKTAFDTFIAAVATFVADAVVGATVEFVSMSKGTDSGTPPVVVAPAAYQISGSDPELLLSTQRRRMRRNG